MQTKSCLLIITTIRQASGLQIISYYNINRLFDNPIDLYE